MGFARAAVDEHGGDTPFEQMGALALDNFGFDLALGVERGVCRGLEAVHLERSHTAYLDSALRCEPPEITG